MSTEVMIPSISTLCVMSLEGDTRFQWDPNDSIQVEKVRSQFDELKKKGYAAYTVNSKGDKGVVINSFDPTAERIIMALPMVGG